MPFKTDTMVIATAGIEGRLLVVRECVRRGAIALLLLLMLPQGSEARPRYASPHTVSGLTPQPVEKVIIDTDIGTDIDDAFALALALRSPEIRVLGFSTASGDTLARARIIDRMLGDSGHASIPVAVGVPTKPPGAAWPAGLLGLQRRYGDHGPYAHATHPQAVDFMLQQIRRFPGQITLVAIGPLSNVGALIDADIASFRKLKRLVFMGGWLGPVDYPGGLTRGPMPEYNVALDVNAAKELFSSGIPIYVMPVDSTIHLLLDEVKRQSVFSQSTPLTDSLALLYLLWGKETPVLYDAMAVAFISNPELCPVQPLHLVIDDKGFTRTSPGSANAQVCLHSDPNAFLDYFMRRLIGPRADDVSTSSGRE